METARSRYGDGGFAFAGAGPDSDVDDTGATLSLDSQVADETGIGLPRVAYRALIASGLSAFSFASPMRR